MKYQSSILLFCFLLIGCNSQKSTAVSETPKVIVKVNPDYFKSANATSKVTLVPCALSDGTSAECFEIVSNSLATDHEMGPWCPTNISDDDTAGGIWLQDGKVHDVDGSFIKNLANFYGDAQWQMYDDKGNISVTNTKEDCSNAARPDVGDEYKNFCVECLPSYLENISQTYLIPASPVFSAEPIAYQTRGGGPGNGNRPEKGTRPEKGDKPDKNNKPERGGRPERGGSDVPSSRGIALNGVEFSAPAPVNNILSAYTIAPFDDAGGHINLHQGYHYHAATGVSYSVAQSDGHAPLIGYALDGHGIYGNLDKDKKAPTDLDDCRGHYDDLRGYHYHVDAAGSNNFINCIHGAYAKQ